MEPILISGLFSAGMKLIERFFPDPAEADKAKLELLKMQQQGELANLAATTELAKAQILTNQTEAANPNLFVSGWRPGVGWVCVVGLAYQFLIRPLAIGFGMKDFPVLDMGDLVTLLGGLLGLGTLRTFEKTKGVA